ncbi:hypothetical protein DSECCO2_561960 [anaerobic digester metagenome]
MKMDIPRMLATVRTFSRTLRRVSSSPKAIPMRMNADATITPPWNPPPARELPWRMIYRPKTRMNGTISRLTVMMTTFSLTAAHPA